MASKVCGVAFSVSGLEKPFKGTKKLYQIYVSELHTKKSISADFSWEIAMEQSFMHTPAYNNNLLQLT